MHAAPLIKGTIRPHAGARKPEGAAQKPGGGGGGRSRRGRKRAENAKCCEDMWNAGCFGAQLGDCLLH